MEDIIVLKTKSVNQWNNDYISPGPVAQIGDVMVNEKLKKSCPELAQRFSFQDQSLYRRGAGVQDGYWFNAHNQSLNAKVYPQTFYDSTGQNTVNGVTVSDLRLKDLKADTRMLAAPQFGWKNQKATLLNARVTGQQFLPAADGYSPSGIRRGPQPRVNTLVDNTEAISTEIKPLTPLQPVVNNAPAPNGRDYYGPGVENVRNIPAAQAPRVVGLRP